MNKSESIAEINKAMMKFHQEVKQPLKDADNPYFKSKYVPLESVVEAITDVAPEHGISFLQWALNDDAGRVGVATIVTHESGEYIEFDPVFMDADKNTPQGAGSLITYLKRYTLSAIFGITSDQDDDGNDASQSNQQNKSSNNQSRQANKQELELMHKKANELAGLYQMDPESMKQKLGVRDNHTEMEYKQLLKRINDGIEKAGA